MRLRAQAAYNGAHTLTVAAGDLVDASPLLSAAFHDEPIIRAMNRLHLDVSTVGNHKFDEGYRELRRLQRGGCLDDGPEGVENQNSCPGDSPLGNLIADSQRAFAGAAAPGDSAPADIAFMNPGGIRADLIPGADDALTYGAAFTAQPFNNYVVSMDMTGDQVRSLLEQQWSSLNESEPKILQVSNLTYTWDPAAPVGERVIDGSVEVGGEPLVQDTTYRVVANSFLSDGGDGFAAFTEATDKYVGGLDIDALREYLSEVSSATMSYEPTPTDRIDVVG